MSNFKTLVVASSSQSSASLIYHVALELPRLDALYTPENALSVVPEMDFVFWLDDPLDERTGAILVKQTNPHCILISIAHTRGQSTADLIALALKRKTNLLVECRDDGSKARVLDPLGNQWCDWSSDPERIARITIHRARQLKTFTRSKSIQVGEAVEAPNETRFYEIVRGFAQRFHALNPQPTQIDRALGNASFRCERGFPSFRQDSNGLIFVSRRNTDKTFIDRAGFVAVEPDQIPFPTLARHTRYYGDSQPSVDTPIQIKLYSFYPNVRYMIHGHVYGTEGRFASPEFIPCGALEEFEAIKAAYPDPSSSNFVVNLKGHGSIILASDLDFFPQVQHIPRPFPESFWGV